MIDGKSFLKIVDQAIQKNHLEEFRPYIGASSIGNQCYRAIYYGLHNQKKSDIEPKLIRTFAIGKRLETMIYDYLILAGFTVEIPTQSNDFLYVVDDEFKFFSGHMDGIVYFTDIQKLVLELKTAKAEEYKKFCDLGLKGWSQTYYSQVQAYMGMSKINHCIFIVLNKNTGDWSCEIIEFDRMFYEELKTKAYMIYNAEHEPERINKNPSYWICQRCFYKETCHKSLDIL